MAANCAPLVIRDTILVRKGKVAPINAATGCNRPVIPRYSSVKPSKLAIYKERNCFTDRFFFANKPLSKE